MSLKRLRLPTQLSYPLRITETHVAAGQSVAKGDPIYTLEDATGRRGMMRAPSAGTISEGPIEAGASFSEPTPVIGIVVESPVETEQLSETSDDSRTNNESNKVDEKTIGIEQALINILEQAETATFAKGRSLGAFRTSLEQALRSKGYGEGDSSKAAKLQLVETIWSSANNSDKDSSGAEENLEAKKTVPDRSDENRPLGWLLILLAIIGFAYGQIHIKLAYLEDWIPLVEIIASVIAAGIFLVAFGLILGTLGLVKELQLAAMWFPIGILAMVIAFVPAHEVARWGIPLLNSALHIESDYSGNGQQVSETALTKNDVTTTQSSKIGSENSVTRQTNNSTNASPISPDELGTRDFSDSFASISSDAPLTWVNTAAHPDRHRNRAHAFIMHGSQRVAGPFDQAYWQDLIDPKTNETRNFVVGMCDTSDPENGMWVKLIRGLTLEVLKSWKEVCVSQAGTHFTQGQPSITLTHNFRDIRYSDNQQTTLFKHDHTVIDAETFEELHSFTLPNSTLCSFDSRVRGSNPSMCRD